jgi:hypothetical protein
LVEFFMAEREAQVVQLGGGGGGGGDEAARSTAASTPGASTPGASTPASRPLDQDLERALTTLIAAGLRPKVLAVRLNRRDISRAS